MTDAGSRTFWADTRVLVTGHTGFKGSWLSLWLATLGADVAGFSDSIPTSPSLCEQAGIESVVAGHRGDVGDADAVDSVVSAHRPDVLFHLAAQPLVRASYDDPVGTFRTNVMGTVNVLEAARHHRVRTVVVVTSDKCYDNRETGTPYAEGDPLGGRDPYSASKACAELVTGAYHASFGRASGDLTPAVVTVRAGNVIGGGDWSTDRLLPDAARAAASGEVLVVRNPTSTRPWQHVLDCLEGYVDLAERLHHQPVLAGAWNFGPDEEGRPVSWVVERAAARWDGALRWETRPDTDAVPEAGRLELNASKARRELGWQPQHNTATAVDRTVDWYRAVGAGEDPALVTRDHLDRYLAERTTAR